MDNRLVKIAEYYGKENQTKKLLQEIGELIVELTAEPPSAGRIAGELADVGIVAEQVAYLYSAESAVKSIRESKITRQLDRIKREEDENS